MSSTRPGTLGSTDLAYTPKGGAGSRPQHSAPVGQTRRSTFQQGGWVGGRANVRRDSRSTPSGFWVSTLNSLGLISDILSGFISDGQSPLLSVVTVGKPEGPRAHGQPCGPSISRPVSTLWLGEARTTCPRFLLWAQYSPLLFPWGFPQSLELNGAQRKGGAVAAEVPGPRQQVAVCTKDIVFLGVSWAKHPSLLQTSLLLLL